MGTPPREPREQITTGGRWAGRLAEGGLLILARSLRLLPFSLLLWLGRRLGDLAYWTLSRRRAVARRNLALAFGQERRVEELDRLCRQSFQHLGMTFVEVLAFLLSSPAFPLSRMKVEGMEYLQSAMAQGKGVLLLTGHLGNWELLGAAHILSSYPLSVVARPLDSPIVNGLVTRLREGSGFEVIAKRRALPEILEALRRQRMVAILLDQNVTRREGVFVPFFGRLASTSKSLAILALRTEAPVVPIFIHRESGGGHTVVIRPQIPQPKSGDREEDITAFTAAFTRCVEEMVRTWPEQWFWVHRRWKTRPPEETTTTGVT